MTESVWPDEKSWLPALIAAKIYSGFTHCSRLLYIVLSSSANDNPGEDTELRALVKGPYGITPPLHSYGTVLLFATGIGISGQLPHLKQLMDDYHGGVAKARKVALFWELKSERR